MEDWALVNTIIAERKKCQGNPPRDVENGIKHRSKMKEIHNGNRAGVDTQCTYVKTCGIHLKYISMRLFWSVIISQAEENLKIEI